MSKGMSRSVVVRAVVIAAMVAVLAAPPVLADRVELIRRIDMSGVLGPVEPGYRIPAITHDGTNLWLVHPDGSRLLEIEPTAGTLVESVPLTGHDPVEAAGLAFGDGSIWLLDGKARELLRVAPDGQVQSATDLKSMGSTSVPMTANSKISPILEEIGPRIGSQDAFL